MLHKYDWLLNNKNRYIKRVFANCEDGTNIWDSHSQTATTLRPTTKSPIHTPPKWLDDLLDKDIDTIDDVVDTLDVLVNNTEDSIPLNYMENINRVIEVISKLDEYLRINETMIDSEISINITDIFVQSFSQLINQRQAWMDGTDSQRSYAASQLLNFIQTTAFSTNCYLNDTINTMDNEIVFEYNSSHIEIPEGIIVPSDPSNRALVCQQNTKIGALIQGLEDNLIGDQTDQQQINTPILAFSLDPSLNNHQLYGKYVSISLKHNNRLYLGDDIKCVFWDFSHQKWSQDGCRYVISQSTREHTVCKCDHLTNFAALMDTSGRETDSLAKNVLTLLFCSLSVICLIITIVIIMRKDLLIKLRKRFLKTNTKKSKPQTLNQITIEMLKRRDLIVLNLCVCLLVADLLIMIGMDRNESLIVCQFISALLLYALLSVFLWMLLQSFHLFRMTYNVFHKSIKAYGFYLFAYGMPVLIIIIGLLSVWNNEESFGSALVGNDYL
ncbi:adhesion G protein-coupled receptor L3-like [Oppia nitens]|uniref:adhesion G protein-coupled receptor L3-like n=1 Tax=Oppia nitens TaxID=1686743 RepID=UPI0023DA13C9|nr:adhesion G protein-coupled receptor L3-like [Oppia nitens]